MKPWEKDLVCADDGYYYYWPTNQTGAYSAELLKEISKHLDEINKPWDEQVVKHFMQNTFDL